MRCLAQGHDVFDRIAERTRRNGAHVGPNCEVRPPQYSDDALALNFSDVHADDRRYVADWGKWLVWDGTIWRFDKTKVAFDDARKICRAASANLDGPDSNLAKALASSKTVAAVIAMASSDRRHAATVEQWDRDEWLLNTPGGVIDLRTGKLRPHRATDYITKTTAVASDCKCPISTCWRSSTVSLAVTLN